MPLYIVIGTRAQMIKMGIIMKLLEDHNIPYKFIYTEQHKVTIDDLLENFKIKTKPIFLINSNQEAKTIKLFGKWALKMIAIFLNPFSGKRIFPEKGLVLVHGDTASTVWGAVYAKSRGCKVMHIESGLRSFNLSEPFPEEIQRLITFQFSDYYICPNEWAFNNLSRYKGEKFISNGNTMYDSFKMAYSIKDNKELEAFRKSFGLEKKFGLVSFHRHENIFDLKNLNFIINTIQKISQKMPLVITMHPATEIQLKKEGFYAQLVSNKKIKLLPRQDFINFASLAKLSEFMITDGGSNQEEMSYVGKPTLLLRSSTERIEGLNENVVLSKYDENIINEFIENYRIYLRSPQVITPSPSEKIVDYIISVIRK